MDRMTKEAIRYLGYGRNAVDEQTLALIKDSFEGLRSAVSPKSICRIFDLQHQSEECFQIGNIRMKSRSLGTVSYTHLDVYKRQDDAFR